MTLLVCRSVFFRAFKCSLLGLAVLLLSGASLFAQEAGTIVGTVTDSSGAVIPDAQVTTTNQKTGTVARTITRNSSGNYIFNALPLSTNSIRVQKEGFTTSVRSDLALNVNSEVRVDFSLAVGEVTQEVTVSASAVQLQTENAEVGESVTSGRVEAIDINGRNFIQLATLVPGAVGPSLIGSFNNPVGVTANAGINFNGERQSYNVFSVTVRKTTTAAADTAPISSAIQTPATISTPGGSGLTPLLSPPIRPDSSVMRPATSCGDRASATLTCRCSRTSPASLSPNHAKVGLCNCASSSTTSSTIPSSTVIRRALEAATSAKPLRPGCRA